MVRYDGGGYSGINTNLPGVAWLDLHCSVEVGGR